MKVITFLNSKGGVGKTTLTANVGYGLMAGKAQKDWPKIILVDADPQGSLRDWHDTKSTMSLDVQRYETLICADSRQSLLSSHRVAKESGHDYMLIDTAGKLHAIAGAALSVTNLVVIPLQPSALDVWATIDSIDLVRAAMQANSGLRAVFVINQAIANSTLNSEVLDAIKESAPEIPIADQIIFGRVAYARSSNAGTTVYHTRDHQACSEITELTSQLIRMLNDKQERAQA